VKEYPNSEKDDDSILVDTKAKETVAGDEIKDTNSKVVREMKKLQGSS
jgi:hypothetical protein